MESHNILTKALKRSNRLFILQTTIFMVFISFTHYFDRKQNENLNKLYDLYEKTAQERDSLLHIVKPIEPAHNNLTSSAQDISSK